MAKKIAEVSDAVLEMVNQARMLIQYSLANRIKPMVAIVVCQKNGVWENAFMCLYAADTKPDTDGKQVMPLTPFFYSHEVATELVKMNVLIEQHVSEKTGIQVHWCSITEAFVI